MLNVSKEFRAQARQGRAFYVTARCTLSDGTIVHMGKQDFYLSGNGIVDSSDSAEFPLGVAIEKTATLSLVNDGDKFSSYNFNRARIVLYLNLPLPSGRVETIKKGTFIVSKKPTTGNRIDLTLFDHMYQADKSYASNLIFPATVGEVLRDSCQTCGIALGDATFPNSGYVVKEKPEDTTHRAVIGACAMLAGGNARLDNDDYLRIITFDKATQEAVLDGGLFSPWTKGDVADGGTFRPWTAGANVDGGHFGDRDGLHVFSAINNLLYDTDDVEVTGVKAVADETGYLYGKEGYVLDIQNPLIGGDIEGALRLIGGQVVGLTMRPFSLQNIADPTMEFMDPCVFSDTKGNLHFSYITNVDFLFSGYTKVSNTTKGHEENAAEFCSGNAAVVDQAKKEAEKLLSGYDVGVRHMNELAANTLGYHYTELVDEGGRITAYRHDKPELSESKVVYKKGIDGFFVTRGYTGNDATTKWTSGFDSNGDAVLNILYAIGIQAEWINTRGLTAKDNAGNITFRVDAGTGEIDMVVSRFSLTSGETISSIAQAEAEAAKKEAIARFDDFISTVYDPKIAELQKDIDGQIETWYYDHEPTLSSIPASGWKTEADRVKHEGDLFYWKAKGYSYRFLKEGNTWKWQLITDSDITKALADAAQAKDTADNKRRIFVTQPTPPYDKGDLWTQGKDGDIKVCSTARVSGSYVSSDWVLASNYIDATKVPGAWADEKTGASQDQVLKKLTNNYADKGIYLQNGKLYISFNAARGGELTLGGANNGYGLMRVLDAYDKEIVTADRTGLIVKGSGTEEMRMNSQLLQFWYGGQLVGWASAIGSSGINIIGHKSDRSGICRVGGDLNYVDVGNNRVLMIGDICCVGKKPDGSSSRENPAIYSMSDVSATPEKRIEFSRGQFRIIGGAQVSGSFSVSDSLTVMGTLVASSKSNLVKTQDYDDRLLYCYEMPSPMYGDIGEGETDADGVCCIFLDDVFAEAIAPGMRYQVFLQKEGPGDLWVGEKQPGYFVVNGTPGLKFAWEVRARQKGQECTRLEQFDGSESEPRIDREQQYVDEYQRSIVESEACYMQQYVDEYQKLIDEREAVLYEAAQ